MDSDLELDFEATESDDDDLLIEEGFDGAEDDFDFDEDEGEEMAGESAESPELLGGLLFHGINKLVSRRPARKFSTPRAVGGVKSATLNTPRGSARLKLSRAALPVATFNRTMRVVNGRLNTLNRDVAVLKRGLARTNKESRRVSLYTRRAIAATNRRTDRKIKSAGTNSMMMSMIMMMQQQRRIAILHPGAPGGQGNQMAMMLPMMMMMGGSGKGSSNSMMMPMMMMMMGGFGN